MSASRKTAAATVITVLSCFYSYASAAIIELDFAGVVAFSSPGNYHNRLTGQFIPLPPGIIPFTAQFTFDTSLGQITSVGDLYTLSGSGYAQSPATSGSITISGWGLYGFATFGRSWLSWTGSDINPSSITEALAQDGGFSDFNYSPALTVFQTGTCPGSPCGGLTIQSLDVSITGAFSVPAPEVGAGFPGMIAAFALYAATRLRRRRMNRTLSFAGR